MQIYRIPTNSVVRFRGDKPKTQPQTLLKVQPPFSMQTKPKEQAQTQVKPKAQAETAKQATKPAQQANQAKIKNGTNNKSTPKSNKRLLFMGAAFIAVAALALIAKAKGKSGAINGDDIDNITNFDLLNINDFKKIGCFDKGFATLKGEPFSGKIIVPSKTGDVCMEYTNGKIIKSSKGLNPDGTIGKNGFLKSYSYNVNGKLEYVNDKNVLDFTFLDDKGFTHYIKNGRRYFESNMDTVEQGTGKVINREYGPDGNTIIQSSTSDKADEFGTQYTHTTKKNLLSTIKEINIECPSNYVIPPEYGTQDITKLTKEQQKAVYHDKRLKSLMSEHGMLNDPISITESTSNGVNIIREYDVSYVPDAGGEACKLLQRVTIANKNNVPSQICEMQILDSTPDIQRIKISYKKACDKRFGGSVIVEADKTTIPEITTPAAVTYRNVNGTLQPRDYYHREDELCVPFEIEAVELFGSNSFIRTEKYFNAINTLIDETRQTGENLILKLNLKKFSKDFWNRTPILQHIRRLL